MTQIFNKLLLSSSVFMAANAVNVSAEGDCFKNVFDHNQSFVSELRQTSEKTISKAESSNDLKGEVSELLAQLLRSGIVVKADLDENVRPSFVTLQGVIEQNLALLQKAQKVKKVVGIIHTPTPATPLCTEGEISNSLVHPSLLNDENRLFTVRSRANIVRDFLDSKGELFAVFPKGGLEKRSLEQQNIFQQTLEKYPNLHSVVLSEKPMDLDMVGATYLFEDNQGKEYLFSISASQANAPETKKVWAMWFGETNQQVIAQRLSRVREFLADRNGPELKL